MTDLTIPPILRRGSTYKVLLLVTATMFEKSSAVFFVPFLEVQQYLQQYYNLQTIATTKVELIHASLPPHLFCLALHWHGYRPDNFFRIHSSKCVNFGNVIPSIVKFIGNFVFKNNFK